MVLGRVGLVALSVACVLSFGCAERKLPHVGRIARAPIELPASRTLVVQRIPLELAPPGPRFRSCGESKGVTITPEGTLTIEANPDREETFQVCVVLEDRDQVVDTHNLEVKTKIDPKDTVESLRETTRTYLAALDGILRTAPSSIPTRCGEATVGPIEVIQANLIRESTKQKLDTFDPPFGHENAKLLRTPQTTNAARIRYLTEPSEKRPLVAIVAATHLREPVYHGPGLFTGGAFKGWVIVGDPNRGVARCRAPLEAASSKRISFDVPSAGAADRYDEGHVFTDFSSSAKDALWFALEAAAPKVRWRGHWRDGLRSP